MTASGGAFLLLAALLLPSAAADAQAKELRSFCPDRPGLGTPPCTMDPGHADIEIGIADWTLRHDAGVRTDSFAFADSLLRYGVTESLELQLEWQGIGTLREHARGAGTRHSTGSGDLRIALRRNLHNPDGSGFSIALMPFLTLPVGSHAFGAGDWTAGLLVPVSYALPKDMQLAFTGEADAAADGDGRGHHFAYAATLGLGLPLAPDLGAALELQHSRDEDPAGSSDATLGGLSFAWQRGASIQLDAGANFGLSGTAPDFEIYAGVAKRF
ncbi:MAG: transporter [Sphingomonadales bacterium]